jgi:hypothetical protein
MGLKIKQKTEKREIRRKNYRNTEKERLKVRRKTEHRIGLRAEWLNKANSRSNRDTVFRMDVEKLFFTKEVFLLLINIAQHGTPSPPAWGKGDVEKLNVELCLKGLSSEICLAESGVIR